MKELEPLQQIDFPQLLHDLAQPLTSISGYLAGCIYRLTNGTPDNELILLAMNKIVQDIEHAQQLLLRLKNCINKTEIN